MSKATSPISVVMKQDYSRAGVKESQMLIRTTTDSKKKLKPITINRKLSKIKIK